MQKDVIYIDTEDDITAIIGKVKASKEHIVALVPPKRIGAIQSAVNLKLVHRAAEAADKRLVIISNNAALTALSASAGIPVAKNLQSKPELAEIPALDIDDGNDVIDGDTLPGAPASGAAVAAVATAPEADVSPSSAAVGSKTKNPKAGALGAAALAAKDKVKIPDFDKFRKKLFLIIGGAVLLVAFLIWAIFFAPSAKIIVTAKTSEAALNSQVKVGDALSTDLKAGTIKTVTKTSQKSVSKQFSSTGKKDVGTKATGTVSFSTNLIDNLDTTIPAGTTLTSSGGSTYTTDSSVTFTRANSRGVTVGITATANGASYNGANGQMSGVPSGVSATVGNATSGGTDKTINVVQQSDVDQAMNGLVSQSDQDAAKKALAGEFGKDYVVLDASFKSDTGAVKSSPAVGAEGDNATLSGAVTFSMAAVSKDELSKFLDAYFAQQLDGKADQKLYSNGADDVGFTNVSPTDGGWNATITTNGKIGPKIDANALKEYAKGKRLGEIQTYVQNVNGVENVDVKLSPFWVRAVPNDTNKISVEFKITTND
jgi:hypothetical protein